NLIAQNDDASGSLNSYIQTELRDAGVYYIVARDVREGYGSYELTVTLVREPEPVVAQAIVVQPIVVQPEVVQPVVVQPEAVQPVVVQPAEVRQADLRFDDISYDINPDNRECTISF
ncbi:MAG TPA: hypothetical protein PLZ51_25225, partial [Aggregatilineales bacterium]|nr:hypothetical protein [Aggregatilineales bacterium]